MPLQIETLLALQEIDTEIERLRKELSRLDTGADLRRRYEALRVHCEKLEANLRGARGSLADTELELKGVEAKKKEFEKRLYDGKVTNPKELTAIEREIEMLGRLRGTLDERILGAMEAIETAESELTKYTSARDRAEAAWRAQDAAYLAGKAKLEAALAELAPRREARAAEVEAPTLRRYDDLRARTANLAIARIHEATCGGCHTNLARSVVQRVQEHAVYVFCENCRRFLAPEG
jgi:predicted  nucleic acid-binding Zn-ribbon protein